MADPTEEALMQIDEVLARVGLAPGQHLELAAFGEVPGREPGEVGGLTGSLIATIERLTPSGSRYRAIAQKELDSTGAQSGYTLAAVVGLVNQLRADYEHGYMGSVAELIHAGLFGDFLEMASELLGKGYKDPSAVLAGSTLEEHLRKLAVKHGIPAESAGKPKKADLLNAELVKSAAYSGLVQKQITAWLDLRNRAAHGKYGDYSKEEVALMLEGVRSFIGNNPA